jgi:hypothetical protein
MNISQARQDLDYSMDMSGFQDLSDGRRLLTVWRLVQDKRMLAAKKKEMEVVMIHMKKWNLMRILGQAIVALLDRDIRKIDKAMTALGYPV